MTPTHHICKNCGNHYKGNFCGVCGQKFNVEPFTFKHIFEEVLHAFTHADKSFLVLVKKIILNPGKVAFEFIVEGKRKKYYNLFTFFVIILAINAFVSTKDLNLKEELFHENNEYGHIFNLYSKLLTFVSIPILAFFTWLIYYRRQHLRFSEYTVFAMVLMTVDGLVSIFYKVVNYVGTFFTHRYISIDDNFYFALLELFYIAYACYVFHRCMQRGTWWQALLSGTAFMLVEVGISVFMIWSLIRHFDGLGIFTMYGFRISG